MKQLEKITLPTDFGDFEMLAYDSEFVDFPHIVLISSGETDHKSELPNVRVHSECMTGDVFSSLRCDCGDQLNFAMAYIAKHGGLIVYLRQEGRGIGIVNKMKAYNLQDEGYDTVDANEKLGFHQDARDFDIASMILKDLNVSHINVLTNNPRKIASLQQNGIEIAQRIAVEIEPHKGTHNYLKVKKEKMGHLLNSV
jgi:3,4-dihydroxy 2-butanone 4-phosphate synthase/GTP cyclohydrolase II